MDATGFVTAGGRSSRMGRDKAWLQLGQCTMIERIIAALAPITSSIAIIANSDEYRKLGLPIYSDTNVGIGPVEAIRTALVNSPTELAVLVGCDLPFVTPELFAFLIDEATGYEAVVPVGPDAMIEPLCAVYSTKALWAVTDLIEIGERKVSRLLDRIKTRLVTFDELRSLRGSELFFENVNTPEDYRRALELLRRFG
jgi:molybdopterin-guanine dinucleotide biosynthesis protein A